MPFVPDEAPTAAPAGRFVPDAPAPGEQDTSSLEAFRKSGMPPEKETGLEFPGSKAVGEGESALSLATGLASGVVAPVVGVAKTLTSGKFGTPEGIREGEQAAADVVKAGTYQPRTATGRRNVGTLGSLFESSKLAGFGPPEALAMPWSLAKPSVPLPGITSMEPQLTTPKARGAGAERVVNEMQTQSGIMDKKAPVRDAPNQSAFESAMVDLDNSTIPLRNAAFKNPAKVDMGGALAMIDKLESQTTNPGVLKALGETRKIINDSIEKGAPAAPVSDRMSAAEYRSMLAGAEGKGTTVRLLDENRQAINNIINGIGQGEKPYGPFAQKELFAVQQEMLKTAPQEYLKYLSEYAKGAKGLDKFRAPGGAREKLTTDPAAFPSINAADKQGLMEKLFTGATPGRALTEAVRDTAHSPEAATGLRGAYTDWLTTVDPRTGMPKAGDLITKWAETKDAVRSSGLMTPEHAAAMDKIVSDLGSVGSGKIAKAWASTVGFFAGSMMGGRPIVGAHLARDIATETISRRNLKALEAAVAKIAADPEGAAVLAAPPTPANIERVRLMLPTDVAALIAIPGTRMQQQDQQPKRKGNAMDAINATLPVMPNVRAPQPQEGMWVRG